MEEQVKKEKKRTIFSKIILIYVVIQCILAFVINIAYGLTVRVFERDLYQYWSNSIWSPLSKILSVVPVILAIPILVLSIIGMIKEKRVLFFVLCMIVSAFAWLFSFSIVTAFV